MIFPASTNGGGECMAPADVCKTQVGPAVVPIPYPNIAQLTDANAGTCSETVKIMNKNACVETSEITQSSGDEAGAEGGVISSMISGPARFSMGSTKVLFDGTGATYLTSTIGQNGTNANMPMGTQIAPSQAKVLVSP